MYKINKSNAHYYKMYKYQNDCIYCLEETNFKEDYYEC